MAAKRMFLIELIDSDRFLEMPVKAQNLYFHLGMRADDDGFVNNPRKIMRMTQSTEEDMKILLEKGFLIGFDSGVVVIKHWLLNNQIRKDRRKETIHIKEKASLCVKKNKEYELAVATGDTTGLPDDNHMATQISSVQVSLDQDRKERYRLNDEILTKDEYMALIQLYPERTVEEVIHRILNKPYHNCLNVRTITEWCEQRKNSITRMEGALCNQTGDDVLMKIAMERR